MKKSFSIAEMLRWGDLYNHQTYRAIFEASNRARPKNNLNLLWKSNAAWPSFVWQIYDWTLRPNAGYYTMKAALEPLHVQFSHSDKGVQVISTLAEDRPVQVTATVSSPDGKVVGRRSWDTIVKADQSMRVGSLSDMVMDGPLFFIALDLKDGSNKPIGRTVSWTQKDARWQDLLSIPPVDLDVRITNSSHSGDEHIYELAVTNPSALPAVNVMIELSDGLFGGEILPSFWNDNAFTLMPGEGKTLQVLVRRNMLPKLPHFIAEGLNVNPSCWDADTGQVVRMQAAITKLEARPGQDGTLLLFSAQRLEQSGTRITTGPVALMIDGKLLRYVSIAAGPDQEISGRVKLPPLPPGKHRIQLGKKVIETGI